MKKIVFIVGFLMLIKPVLPVVEYMVNYDYISKVLCENKTKPKLKCNGKCHLMKELAKASEDEKPINSDKKDNSKHEVEILFFQEITNVDFFQVMSINKRQSSINYTNIYDYLDSKFIFHPPIFIS